MNRERLRHDVGKYIARTACNLPETAQVPQALVPLLLRDLYGDPSSGEPRASETFERLTGGDTDAVLGECRQHLKLIDDLEASSRRGNAEALAQIASAARAVARLLRRESH